MPKCDTPLDNRQSAGDRKEEALQCRSHKYMTEGKGSLRKHKKTWVLVSSCHCSFMKRKNLKH